MYKLIIWRALALFTHIANLKGGMFNRLYNVFDVCSEDVTLTSNKIHSAHKTDAFSKYANKHAQYICILTTMTFTAFANSFTNVLPYALLLRGGY